MKWWTTSSTSGGAAAASAPARAVRTPALLKLALALAAVLVTLAALELGIRVVFGLSGTSIATYRPSFYYAATDPQFDRRRFVAHPFQPYAPRPHDARTLVVHRKEIQADVAYRYRNNSLGFRTPERPFAKPPGTRRIVTLGGSTTWDGPDDATTWPALLEQRLNEHYGGRGHRIEVVNLAVDGATSAVSLMWLAMLGVAYAPDLVVSGDGVNDFAASFYAGIAPDYRNAMRRFDDAIDSVQLRLPPWAFASYLVSVASARYDTWRTGGIPLNVHAQMFAPINRLPRSDTPLASIALHQRNVKVMRGIAAEHGARFLGNVPHWAAVPPALDAYDRAMREFFARERIAYVDLQASLPHGDFSLHADQVHWTTKGLHAVADAWFTRIVADDLLALGR